MTDMEQPRETILITGAAGFIGYHLSRRLLEGGYAIVGYDNLNDYYDPLLKRARLERLSSFPAFSFVAGDLADMSALEAVFALNEPEIVVHLAAQAGVRYSIENPRVYIESNVTGFFNLLETLRRHRVRHLLFASSSSVYGNAEKVPFSVTDPVDCPVSLYAATKRCDEMLAYCYAHLYGMPATGMRFFTVYGPFGRPDMAYFKFTKAIFENRPIEIYNNGDLLRDFTYVDDVTACVESMLLSPPQADASGARYAVYNIGNNRPERLMDFIETLERATGRIAAKRFLPMQPGDVRKTYADITETARDFGFAPKTPLSEGIPRFVEWYRDYYGTAGQ